MQDEYIIEDENGRYNVWINSELLPPPHVERRLGGEALKIASSSYPSPFGEGQFSCRKPSILFLQFINKYLLTKFVEHNIEVELEDIKLGYILKRCLLSIWRGG